MTNQKQARRKPKSSASSTQQQKQPSTFEEWCASRCPYIRKLFRTESLATIKSFAEKGAAHAALIRFCLTPATAEDGFGRWMLNYRRHILSAVACVREIVDGCSIEDARQDAAEMDKLSMQMRAWVIMHECESPSLN